MEVRESRGLESGIEEKEVDMFNAVDIKTVRGVKKLRKGILPDVPAYRFRREVHGLQFPADIAARLRHDVRGALTMHFVGKQNKRTDSVLFSVDVPGASSPWLRLSSDVKHKLLRLQATIKDGRRQTLTLPNAFVDHKHWHKVALAINTTHVRMYIDCVQDHVSKELTGVDFAWPENASVSILQDSHGGNSFKGSMQVATLYLRNVKQKPWLCNETEKPGQDTPSRSKNQGAPRANNNVEMKGQRGPQKAARDKLTAADRQKAAEVPAGVLTMKNWKGLIENDLMGMLDHSPRIVEYQHTMEALRIEVEKLKTKNEALTRRVTSLETCECQQRAASPCLSQPCL
ncbi:PREDICTED: kielin/chordin-like protein [Priapulus caudatus]|uniref:Kielin/chordin-like protein n=1 Tax=Priapulus caudatus TaxID=37621 RepID=A0ABM1EUX4_PRICU|nr:PREDICTED: kielin/chordin-like protein [Priapulus caudatus]